MLSEKAYAKINLSLDILSKREDGFHEIESLMQLTGLYDRVGIEKNAFGELRMFSESNAIPKDQNNICIKAAKAYFDYFNISDRGFDIHLSKNIPVCAGLGGGSADGSAVIRLLARYFSKGDKDELCEISAKVGSDVAFTTVGGSAVCRGRGELMEKLSSKLSAFAVIAKNTTGLSTPLMYSLYDELEEPESHPTTAQCVEALERGELELLAKSVFNVMEQVSIPKRPAIALLKEKMLDMGAKCSLMSGSGPSVFGLFENESKAKSCCEALRREKITAYSVELMNKTLI